MLTFLAIRLVLRIKSNFFKSKLFQKHFEILICGMYVHSESGHSAARLDGISHGETEASDLGKERALDSHLTPLTPGAPAPPAGPPPHQHSRHLEPDTATDPGPHACGGKKNMCWLLLGLISTLRVRAKRPPSGHCKGTGDNIPHPAQGPSSWLISAGKASFVAIQPVQSHRRTPHWMKAQTGFIILKVFIIF